MPLLRKWNINENAVAAIWLADEPEAYFAEQTGLQPPISHEKRRTEHLAGRFLLKLLKNDFPLHDIKIDEHGKPHLAGDDVHFSVSHSWPYIAAVIDNGRSAGIDVQTWTEKIVRIKHKFLSEGEQELLGHDPRNFLAAWSAKETAYKWHGKDGTEFIEELPIIEFPEKKYLKILFNLNGFQQILHIRVDFEPDFVCTYLEKVEMEH